MATKSELDQLLDLLYQVRSFADKIQFRIENEIDEIIDIIESEQQIVA